ncbi:MAG: hypothetical protein PHG18_03725 [Bacilli bacterium]|nr:hypothetical protein [Bacilli bacterium]
MDATTINSILGSILVVLILLAKWQYSLHGKTSANSESIINLVKTDEKLEKADKDISEEIKRQEKIRDDKFDEMEKRHSIEIKDFRKQNYNEHKAIVDQLTALTSQVSENIGLTKGIQTNIQILVNDKNES